QTWIGREADRGGRGARARRLPRQQRWDRLPGELRRADGRTVERDVAGERDELRPGHPRVAALDARAQLRGDRQRFLDRGETTFDRDARLLSHQGGRSFPLSACCG